MSKECLGVDGYFGIFDLVEGGDSINKAERYSNLITPEQGKSVVAKSEPNTEQLIVIAVSLTLLRLTLSCTRFIIASQ